MEKIYKFENAKATVDENGVITVVVNEIYQPKDGEIVMFQDRPNSVFIYKKVDNMGANATTYYVALCAGINLFYNDPEYHMLRGYDFTDVVPATEEAKQLLFDALESKNLMWDPETKQVVKWRAKDDGEYFYMSDYGDVNISFDNRSTRDNQRFEFGNYFATEELARKAMKNIKNSLAL
jgi:hypothetical protein